MLASVSRASVPRLGFYRFAAPSQVPALAHWVHPKGGLAAGAADIPTALETGAFWGFSALLSRGFRAVDGSGNGPKRLIRERPAPGSPKEKHPPKWVLLRGFR
jgi:hypothetical protein